MTEYVLVTHHTLHTIKSGYIAGPVAFEHKDRSDEVWFLGPSEEAQKISGKQNGHGSQISSFQRPTSRPCIYIYIYIVICTYIIEPMSILNMALLVLGKLDGPVLRLAAIHPKAQSQLLASDNSRYRSNYHDLHDWKNGQKYTLGTSERGGMKTDGGLDRPPNSDQQNREFCPEAGSEPLVGRESSDIATISISLATPSTCSGTWISSQGNSRQVGGWEEKELLLLQAAPSLVSAFDYFAVLAALLRGQEAVLSLAASGAI